MIYSDRDVRLFRGVVIAISLATLAVAALTYVSSRTPNIPEVVAALLLGLLLYGTAEWLLPLPLPPPRTPRPHDAPPPMQRWERD